jgi:hypothetical protein
MTLPREPARRPDGTPARTAKDAKRFRDTRLSEVAMHRRGVQAFHGPRAERILLTELHLADDLVRRAITRDVLDPEIVGEALDLALRELEQPAAAGAAPIETQG